MFIQSLARASEMDIAVASQTETPGRIERRMEQVVGAAVQRFAANGYNGTTIKEIAETAGVSPGLIYSYIKDKEELLLLVFRAIFRTYQEEIPKVAGVNDPIKRFSSALRGYCKAVDRNVGAAVVGYQESKSLCPERRKVVKALELETNRLITDTVRDCISAGYFRALNPDLVTFRLVLFAHGWALKNWYFREVATLDRYIEDGLDLILHALLTPRGRRHWRSLNSAALPRRPRRHAALRNKKVGLPRDAR